MAGTAFDVLGVLLEQAFVGVALDVGGEAGPLLLVNQVHDEPAELGRVLDLVLGFAEDDAEHARPFAEFFQCVAVVGFEFVAVLGEQGGPVFAPGDGGGFVEGRFGLLIGHFEEQEEGELLDVVAVGEAVIPEDVAVVPELLDELLGHRINRGLRGWGSSSGIVGRGMWGWSFTSDSAEVAAAPREARARLTLRRCGGHIAHRSAVTESRLHGVAAKAA